MPTIVSYYNEIKLSINNRETRKLTIWQKLNKYLNQQDKVEITKEIRIYFEKRKIKHNISKL